MARIQHMSRRSRIVLFTTVAIVLVNFAAFINCSMQLGGDALNGHVQAGHYFVCAHGSCHEVTKQIWDHSYRQALSVIGGHSLILLELAFFVISGDMVVGARKGE